MTQRQDKQCTDLDVNEKNDRQVMKSFQNVGGSAINPTKLE